MFKLHLQKCESYLNIFVKLPASYLVHFALQNEELDQGG